MKKKSLKTEPPLKNYWVFKWLVATQTDHFFSKFNALRRSLGLNPLQKCVDILEESVWSTNGLRDAKRSYAKMREEAYVQLEDMYAQLSNDKLRDKAWYGVLKIMKSNRLSYSWKIPLDIFLATGVISIVPDDWPDILIRQNKKKKELTITLQRHTTLADIKKEWKSIHEAQVQLFGENKKFYLTTKLQEHIWLYTRRAELKRLSFETDKENKESRQKSITDLDIVAKLYDGDISRKMDLKRANRMRQVAHRLGRRKLV